MRGRGAAEVQGRSVRGDPPPFASGLVEPCSPAEREHVGSLHQSALSDSPPPPAARRRCPPARPAGVRQRATLELGVYSLHQSTQVMAGTTRRGGETEDQAAVSHGHRVVAFRPTMVRATCWPAPTRRVGSPGSSTPTSTCRPRAPVLTVPATNSSTTQRCVSPRSPIRKGGAGPTSTTPPTTSSPRPTSTAGPSPIGWTPRAVWRPVSTGSAEPSPSSAISLATPSARMSTAG